MGTEIRNINRTCEGSGCERRAEFLVRRKRILGFSYHLFLCEECLTDWERTVTSEWLMGCR